MFGSIGKVGGRFLGWGSTKSKDFSTEVTRGSFNVYITREIMFLRQISLANRFIQCVLCVPPIL